MNRIRLLPEHVANQIAAGEVVERPASVVKELVENALDAEATHVTVDVQAGGRSLIRVMDDGRGMSKDDALLCLERHATSKIQRAEDLSAVVTMGFRGEALPSIASVCRMVLTTREKGSDAFSSPPAKGDTSQLPVHTEPATSAAEGTRIVINGGKIVEVKAAGSPTGTSVEARQLFFNLPARRKFLRSEETEFAHIHHYLTLAALAYPEVAFTFTKDSRLVWQLPAVGPANKPPARLAALRERMRELSGHMEQMLAVDLATDLALWNEPESEADPSQFPKPGSKIQIWGFIGQPGVSRTTREAQHLFVNRRPVENRGLNFALLEGYHTALMKGRYPVCCLFLEIDPASVDVNIHPAKREIRFRDEKAVRHLVAQAVRETLRNFHSKPASAALRVSTPAPAQPVPPLPAPKSTTPPGATKEFPQFTPLTGTPLTAWKNVVPSIIEPSAPKLDSPAPASSESPPPAQSPRRDVVTPIASQQSEEPTPLLTVPLRLIGVIGRLYVVLESDRGLVLMDQHAAHERILFEQMLARLEKGDAPSQRLLLPETVELSVRDANFLRELLPVLNRLGAGLSEFGERTFLLDALPPFVKVSDARRFVLELVDELKAAGEEVNLMRLGEQTIAKTVCRHAVKANDPLAGAELENLIRDLRSCSMPYTCPHGRPTLIEMNYRELEKKFGRVGG